MTKEKTTSQSPEEMAKAAQEAAVKAAMEQAQSMKHSGIPDAGGYTGTGNGTNDGRYSQYG